MTLSKQDFREQIRTEMKVDLDGDIWEDAELDNLIDEAHLKVQADFNFGFPQNQNGTDVFNSSAGVPEYVLPTEFAVMDLVKFGGKVLNPADKIALLATGTLTTQGTPSQFYVYGENIGFDLTPSGTFTVELYFKQIVPPPTENVGSALPSEVNRAIIIYSKYLAWSSPEGKQSSAVEALDEYERAMALPRMRYAQYRPTAKAWGLQRRSSW